MAKLQEDARVEKPAHERDNRAGAGGTVAGRAPAPGLGTADAADRGQGDATTSAGPSLTRAAAAPTGSPEANREKEAAKKR